MSILDLFRSVHKAMIAHRNLRMGAELIEAVRKGDAKTVYSILEKHRTLMNWEDSEKRNLLHLAIWRKQHEIAIWLIKQGADVSNCASLGKTPLHAAAWRNMDKLVSLLIEAGANPNAQDENGWTPLHWAAMCGYQATAHSLVVAGADAGIKDKNGHTAVALARMRLQSKTAEQIEIGISMAHAKRIKSLATRRCNRFVV